MKHDREKIFYEFCKYHYNVFIDKVGSENYPVHNEPFEIRDLPNCNEILDEDGSCEYFCFVWVADDILEFRKFIHNRCSVVWHSWNCKELRKIFDNDHTIFNHFQNNYEKIEHSWASFTSNKVERFQEDTEIIHEGILERVTYFDDNSIHTRQLIDVLTGELIYFREYYKSSYWDKNENKYVSFISGFYLNNKGNVMECQKDLQDEKKRMKITYPKMYAGTYLEDLYFQRYGKYNR